MAALFIGQNRHRLTSVDSTNNYAAKLLQENKISEGSAILADEQLSGRGQRGSHWHSDRAANILCSIVLYPKFLAIGEQFLLSKVVSLGLFDFLSSHLDQDISIKWPNDLMAGGKKIAGILIENGLRSGTLSHSIIGFGLNVNQEGFQTDLKGACSMKMLSGKHWDKELLLDSLFSFIEARYLQLRGGALEKLNANYLEHLLFLDQWREYEIGGEIKKARIEGVNLSGHLILELSKGEFQHFDLKEVRFIL